MNVRKLLIALMIISIVAISSVAFAVEEPATLIASQEVSGELEVVSVDETVVPENETVISGEEAKAEEVVSGEEVVVSEEVVASGEEVVSGEVVTSGEEKVSEEVVASGEEVVSEEVVASGEEAVSGEVVTSGEEAISGEVVMSGEAIIVEEVVSGEEAKEEPEYPVDVEENRWYAPFVKEALEADLMNVNENGEFLPKAEVTKEDVCSGLAKFVKETPDKKEEVKDEEATVGNPLASGESQPVELKDEVADGVITREDAALLLYEVARANGKGFSDDWMVILEYDDVLDISGSRYEAVTWCNVNKVMIGRPDNTFGSKVKMNRAELATVLVRFADVIK